MLFLPSSQRFLERAGLNQTHTSPGAIFPDVGLGEDLGMIPRCARRHEPFAQTEFGNPTHAKRMGVRLKT
jgi:hypothetical protein